MKKAEAITPRPSDRQQVLLPVVTAVVNTNTVGVL